MAKTQITGSQVLDRSIQLNDIDTTSPGQALITKVVAGLGVSIECTGCDPGTGIVTISSDATGSAAYVYDALQQHIDDTSNPHLTTYTQVGADPAGAAAQAYIDSTAYTDTAINTHKTNMLTYHQKIETLLWMGGM